jgi:hypothetical protein
MAKMRHGSIFEGIGITLLVIGFTFVCFSSFYVEPTVPTATVLSVIGHYLMGIAIGAVFAAVGVLMIFMTKR